MGGVQGKVVPLIQGNQTYSLIPLMLYGNQMTQPRNLDGMYKWSPLSGKLCIHLSNPYSWSNF